MNNGMTCLEFLKSMVSEPKSSLCRLGSIGDGGYYIDIDLLKRSTLLVSGGISSNIEFEYDVFRFKPSISILMVDPTISKYSLMAKGLVRMFIPGKTEKLRYFLNVITFWYMLYDSRCQHYRNWLNADFGISSLLERARRLPGHGEVVLKLDIEGGEHFLLEDILMKLEIFNTIIIEFHDFHIKDEQLQNFVKECLHEFELSYFEINPAGGFTKDGYPKNVEITLSRISSLAK